MNAADHVATALFAKRYAGATDTLNVARHELAEWLSAHDLAVVPDAQLVLSELASNAIEASPGTPYHVTAEVVDDGVAISVTNTFHGDLPQAHEWKPKNVLSTQGRGLSIVAALSSSVSVQTHPGKVTVTAVLRVN